jgi:hypothetical protein
MAFVGTSRSLMANPGALGSRLVRVYALGLRPNINLLQIRHPGMFVHLTKAKRLRAGWLLALVYLLCVVAPSFSFALSDGPRTALCPTNGSHQTSIMHVHQSGARILQDVQRDSRAHAHPAVYSHVGMSDTTDDPISIAGETSVPTDDHHQSSGMQCCGMICVNALPAALVEVVRPSQPTSRFASEIYWHLADNDPPRQYRPPIS